jgi:hypothetical protein
MELNGMELNRIESNECNYYIRINNNYSLCRTYRPPDIHIYMPIYL